MSTDSFSEPKLKSMDLRELVKQRLREACEATIQSQLVFFDHRLFQDDADLFNTSLMAQVTRFLPLVSFTWDLKVKGGRRWKWGFYKDRLKELLKVIDETE